MRIPKYNFIEENVRIWREYDFRKLGLHRLAKFLPAILF